VNLLARDHRSPSHRWIEPQRGWRDSLNRYIVKQFGLQKSEVKR
jgi:hypothetical protein